MGIKKTNEQMGWFIHHYGIVCTTFTRLKDALLLELSMTENRPVGMGLGGWSQKLGANRG